MCALLYLFSMDWLIAALQRHRFFHTLAVKYSNVLTGADEASAVWKIQRKSY